MANLNNADIDKKLVFFSGGVIESRGYKGTFKNDLCSVLK